MDFDKKDIEFFENFKGFEDKTYNEILSEIKSLQAKYEFEKKHYDFWKKHPNMEKLASIMQEMQDYTNPNRMYERLGVDILSVHCANNIVSIVDPEENGNLLPETQVLRQNLTDTYGYIIPNIRFLDSRLINDFCFEIYVRNKKVYCGKISDNDLKQNNPREIIKSLYKVCFDYVHYIMTKTDAQKLMELVKGQNPTLVNDIIPNYISSSDFKHICANLIQRKVGIKDITLVFETLNENVKYTQDVNELTDIIEKNLSFAPKELEQ